MRKSDIVRTLADELGLTYVKAEEAAEAVLETIKDTEPPPYAYVPCLLEVRCS